ncbi:LamG domain-containing protein [Pseudonocardia sp. H11422]|uniref:LamG domain-containing protein n=1 Tax=Pseudonocardia sp. H11422 TaxID=2835866 RepID=UPI001BDBCC44|nr:LamG domain-containing protein [Pseudonocardia sp. H11422]
MTRTQVIVAYASHLSAAPGDRVSCMVSCFGPDEYETRLVRVLHGDPNPAGPGARYEPVTEVPAQRLPGRSQAIHSGSFAVLPSPGPWRLADGITLQANIWPTTPAKGRQAVLSIAATTGRGSAQLRIGPAGDLELRLVGPAGAAHVAATGIPLLERQWYLVAAAYDPVTGEVVLVQEPHDDVLRARSTCRVTRQLPLGLAADLDGPLLLAGSHAGECRGRVVAAHLYNGKIERPRLGEVALDADDIRRLAAAEIPADLTDRTAAWDLSRDIATQQVRAHPGRGRDGVLVNLPTRAVTGSNWTGQEMCWRHRPEEYGAVHFHDDDLYDAGWEADFDIDLPPALPSGVYAVHLTAEGAEDHIPLFVRPAPDAERAPVAFVAPTASYLAYANEHMVVDAPLVQLVTDQVPVLQPGDLFLTEHREYGGSTYDTHSDGSGICHSSRLRPILNMRPGTGSWLGGSGSALWQFAADTHIIDWLTRSGVPFDVLTDEDLHAGGPEALAPYRVVVTGTHPEYTSQRMRDAYEAHTRGGGRLMYLGGNGFYWRISFPEDLPGVLEIRRTESGTRTWAARPGEYFHASSGEYGGLWVRAGASPQRLVGVGFAAQGFDISSYYLRGPDSFDPRVGFVFDGVGADERIGDFGLIGGGAAGLEIDRHDVALGSPPHSLVLASSVGHTDTYMLTLEEMLANRPTSTGTQDPLVRADLVFFETAGGGAVFSTGSIAWAGSLSHAGYDNNVARITGNVLRRFLEPAPFPLPGAVSGRRDAPSTSPTSQQSDDHQRSQSATARLQGVPE